MPQRLTASLTPLLNRCLYLLQTTQSVSVCSSCDVKPFWKKTLLDFLLWNLPSSRTIRHPKCPCVSEWRRRLEGRAVRGGSAWYCSEKVALLTRHSSEQYCARDWLTRSAGSPLSSPSAWQHPHTTRVEPSCSSQPKHASFSRSYMNTQSAACTTTCLRLPVGTTACLCVCLSVLLPVCAFACLYYCLLVPLPVCTTACLYHCLSVPLHVCTTA